MLKMNRTEGRVKPSLLQTVSWGAVGLSATLAAIGVAGLVGADSPLAAIGSAIIIAGTLLTEIAAARLPVEAERRWIENRPKGAAVALGFLALTGWNVAAGHLGMVAIDSAGVANAREPLALAAAEADAARTTAEEALAAFDAETERQQDGMAAALRGAFESGYVSAGARSVRTMADPGRETRRGALAATVATARTADAVAEAKLAAAPTGRADLELWAFALILEILKGALAWFSTGIARNIPMGTQIDAHPASLSPLERRALKSRCASILATIRHLEAARA